MPDVKIVLSSRARPVRLPEDLVIYADEQGESSPAGSGEFAVGLAFAPRPIEQAALDVALAARPSYPGHRCTGPYFHASKDCRQCKEVSGTLVREGLGDLFFSSLRWTFSRSDEDHPTRGELHAHAIALALNHVAQGHGVRRIRLRFARMQGLSEQSLKARLSEKDADVHVYLMSRNPFIPHAFVEIIPEQVSAGDPGVQIADRILWQERRGPLDSLGFALEYENVTEGPFTTRHYAKADVTLQVVPHRIPGRPLHSMSAPELFVLLMEIERAVHRLSSARPAELSHLENQVRGASRQVLAKPDIGLDGLCALCRSFLLVVDTLPLYRDDVKEDREHASEAVALAAAIFLGRESWSVTVADQWLDRRAEIIESGRGDLFLCDDS